MKNLILGILSRWDDLPDWLRWWGELCIIVVVGFIIGVPLMMLGLKYMVLCGNWIFEGHFSL